MKVLIVIFSILAVGHAFSLPFLKNSPNKDATRLADAIVAALNGKSSKNIVDFLENRFLFTQCDMIMNKQQTAQFLQRFGNTRMFNISIKVASARRANNGRLIFDAFVKGTGIKSLVRIVALPTKYDRHQITRVEHVTDCKKRRRFY